MSLVKKALQAQAGKNATQSQTAQPSQAAEIAADLAQADSPRTFQLEIMQAAMNADLAQLKTFNDINDKNDFKAQALEIQPYFEFIDEYQRHGDNYPNSVLAWVFVWLVDLKRWDHALQLLPLLVEQQQPLPTVFNTKHWGTFIIDQLYDAGTAQLENNTLDLLSRKPLINHFNDVAHLFNDRNWHESVPAVPAGKLFAMLGKLEQQSFNYGNALCHYIKAQSLNDAAGVKKHAREIAKQLNIEISI